MGYVATQVQAIQGATGTPCQVVENPNPANNNKGGTVIINLIPDAVHLTPLRLDGNLPSDWSSDFPPALAPQLEMDNICGKWMTVGLTWNNLDIHLTNVYAPSGHAPSLLASCSAQKPVFLHG